MKRFLLSMIAVALICTSAFSCNKEDKDKDQDQDNQSQIEQTSSVAEEPEEEVALHFQAFPTLENNNVTLIWKVDAAEYATMQAEGREDDVWQTIKAFENAYGGEVTVVKTAYMDMMPKAVTMQAAGEHVDLLRAQSSIFPNIVVNNVVMSPEDIPGFDAQYFSPSILDVKYKGKGYFLSPKGLNLSPTLVTYNVTMLEENLCKSPLESYDEGNWNWEAFEEIGRAITKDIDGDGTYDRYIMDGTTMGSWMATANAAPLISTSDEGVICNLDNPALLNAWNQNGKWGRPPEQGGIFNLDNSNTIADFVSQKVAFKFFYDPGDDIGFEWNKVPFPCGPDNPDYKWLSQPGGWTVPVSTSNPEGALAWILCQVDESIVEYNNNAMIERLGQEGFEEYQSRYGNDALDKMNFSWSHDQAYNDCYGVLGNLGYLIVTRQLPAATAAEELKPRIMTNLIKTYGEDEVVQ